MAGIYANDRLLTIMPLFHMNAVSVTTMSAFMRAARPLSVRSFRLRGSGRSFRTIEITSFGSVATMLSMLLNTYPEGVPEGLKTESTSICYVRFSSGAGGSDEEV